MGYLWIEGYGCFWIHMAPLYPNKRPNGMLNLRTSPWPKLYFTSPQKGAKVGQIYLGMEKSQRCHLSQPYYHSNMVLLAIYTHIYPLAIGIQTTHNIRIEHALKN